ncbi:1-acyl-sn-glycerol-3-phosphate acyltransferase [Modestobacter sp. I12A-02628]|uniref:1-acyl-sn-glycerol-3-phosphate acyltransferase n=1 Tax=Goekera deserti TaxID=2497753 RepID=A0A7K3WFP1_9ACTN|nr:1-acyl-sn-glycerol-3-phosphate acyltransferase [Goekera deserti]NDI46319.1 1-acyl-sn-glycerol-3-phosphate acyltransferase [Goekera deserti]NEL54749.1 1-acyl-sn-glycerol-3-phosphate acyltransferase [Goekera deserti]
MSRLRRAVTGWTPSFPPLPAYLADRVTPEHPAWFARELAVATGPPWWVWTFLIRRCWRLVTVFGRLEVTGSVAPELRRGPVLIAANHIGDFDMFVLAIALAKAGLVPRFLVTGGIMRTPLVGPALERAGHIRVDRGTRDATLATEVTAVALAHGGQVLAYPEGRVGLAPDGWPELGRSGLARLALEVGVPVLPVSQWGAHEVLQYANDWGKLRTALSAVRRRPALRVHIGPPVDLAGLRLDRRGDAHRARARIAAALTRGLATLRPGELGRPAYLDPTRPTTGVAAHPGGVVPDDVP